MSELYRIKIKSVQGNQVRAQIRANHPDASTNFDYRDFALQILLYTADVRMYWSELPISRADWIKSVENHPLKTVFDTLQGYRNGEMIPSSEAETEPLDSDRNLFEAKNAEMKEKYGLGISSYGLSEEGWYIKLEPNNKLLIDEAYRIITKKPKKSPVKDEDGKIVDRTYYLDFEVIDAKYLAHLVEGMEYETADYELEPQETYYYNYQPPII